MTNGYCYAAYWNGHCKAMASAEPDSISHVAQDIQEWKEDGAKVLLVPIDQAIEDMKKWMAIRKERETAQGALRL